MCGSADAVTTVCTVLGVEVEFVGEGTTVDAFDAGVDGRGAPACVLPGVSCSTPPSGVERDGRKAEELDERVECGETEGVGF